MSVRWAFVGTGRHVQLWIAPAVERAANAEPIGAWSRQRETASLLASRHAIPRVYSSLEDAVADPDVDAIFVATPNGLHAEHTILALQAGKHVLCEKPMAATVAEAQGMVRTAREAGVLLGIGFHLRHHELIAEAKRRIDAGDLGEIRYATALFNLVSSPPPRLTIPHAPWKRDPEQMGGAAALMGMGVHVLDLLRYLVGREVAAVRAAAVGYSAERPLESFGQVILEFDGDGQAHVAYGGSFPLSKNDVTLFGSKSRLVAENVVDVVTSGALHYTVPEASAGRRTETIEVPLVDHYQRQIEAFSRAVEEGTPFGASGVDGLRSVEISVAIIESYRTGERVQVQRTEP